MRLVALAGLVNSLVFFVPVSFVVIVEYGLDALRVARPEKSFDLATTEAGTDLLLVSGLGILLGPKPEPASCSDLCRPLPVTPGVSG